MRLTDKFGIVSVIEAKDYGSAGIDGDSFKLSNAHWATILIPIGALTGNSILKVYTGASAGTKTTAETFTYRVGAGDFKAASADLFGAAATSAALTLTAATYDHVLLAIEIDPATFTDGQPWVTVEVDATATVLTLGAVAIIQPRYAVPATNIA